LPVDARICSYKSRNLNRVVVIAALKNIILRNPFYTSLQEKGSVEAYDIWAENYDEQPGNLMLDMDEQLFIKLLSDVDIKNKQVADIGCGTGRHWTKIFHKQPLSLTGFDVSEGMLSRLKEKFPQAHTYRVTDNLFSEIIDAKYDIIVSTLTVAHIKNISEALEAWCRILKKNGDIIITDFHPNALAFGGKRTFEHHKKQIAVQNFVHYVHEIEEILLKYNFYVVKEYERVVDESVKHYYQSKNALHVYEKFKDSRIIYGLHLRRKA
jgi:ubiquinone/menaquinone biosynthesis C-methylase UbiE